MFSLGTFSSVQQLIRYDDAMIVIKPMSKIVPHRLYSSLFTLLNYSQYCSSDKMDNLPPNDPNRGNDHNGRAAAKEQPYDGNRRNRNGGGNNGQEDSEPMDIMGDMRDSPVVVAMFLVYVATWFLRERCVC